MAATFSWSEDNGAATGSPAHGTTTTTGRTDVNWISVDSSTTAYGSAPITAGTNSFSKYQYGVFGGTYTSISAGLYSAHTAPSGSLATGLSLKGTVTSTYATPAQTTNAACSTDFTTAVAIGSGLTVLFSATGPQAASPSSTLSSGGGFTQYVVSQLQTTTGAASGDMAAITTCLSYDEA